MSNWVTNVQICPGDLVKMVPVIPEFSSKIPLHKIVVDEHGEFMIDWSTRGVLSGCTWDSVFVYRCYTTILLCDRSNDFTIGLADKIK